LRRYNVNMSWGFYLGAIGFFTVVLGVFYAVAWSVLLQVIENYHRYYQKADLQWTGSKSRFPKHRIRLSVLVPGAVFSAWLLVHFVIMP
jgi:hypothetical protein